MARTVNHAVRTIRRDAFVDTAERLFRTRGYESTSIQDLLDDLDASRGAFYHYFGSKSELLEAVVDRMVTTVADVAAPIADDPALRAPAKLRAVFDTITGWKLERADLMHAMLEAWTSDENALMREKYRRHVTRTLMPLLTRIAAQGIDERSFTATSAEGCARTVIHLLLGFQDEALHLIVDLRRGVVGFDEAWSIVSGYPTLVETAAGLPPGTFPAIDHDMFREWFR